MPPTIAPIHVFKADTRFIGVYTPAYSTILARPKAETVGLTPKYKEPTPTAPATIPNITALRLEIKFLTSGRVLVRVIIASVEVSYIMLNVFALAEQRAVPVVRNRRVRGLRLVVSVANGLSISGTG
jgi:hypothetical protein